MEKASEAFKKGEASKAAKKGVAIKALKTPPAARPIGAVAPRFANRLTKLTALLGAPLPLETRRAEPPSADRAKPPRAAPS